MTTMNTKSFLELCAPGIPDLHPYVPGKPLSELERELGIKDSIKLASNENPLGPSPLAMAAVQKAAIDWSRYPDGGGFDLRRALAEYHHVEPEAVIIGNGSNDVLDIIARAFLAPGVEAVYDQHAFAVYPICTQAVGARGRVAPAQDGSRGPRYGHDLGAMLGLINEHTRVVFIANPNNPTGTWLSRDEFGDFIASLPSHVILVIDEAYFEYVQEPGYPDATQWLAAQPNLIVTRTFSKIHGLAGLRVGYGLGHPDIISLLNRVRQPFNVNSIAQAAALAALHDQAHIEASRRINLSGMAQMTAGLQALGLEFIPSVGNFLCVDVGRPAREVDAALLRSGVITRPVANYGLPNHLRVTIGLEAENQRFLQSLGSFL